MPRLSCTSLLMVAAHLSAPPCCQALRCRPKYENRIAARRNGTISIASAAPSPSAPPGIPRWNESVAIKWVALSGPPRVSRSEEHTSELQSPCNLVCRLLLEKKKNRPKTATQYPAHP